MATGECELKEFRRAIGAQLTEGNVIQAKILGAWKNIRISLDAGNQFAQNDTEAEDVASFVVPFASQAFRGHPVGRTDCWQSVTIPTKITRGYTNRHESVSHSSQHEESIEKQSKEVKRKKKTTQSKKGERKKKKSNKKKNNLVNLASGIFVASPKSPTTAVRSSVKSSR